MELKDLLAYLGMDAEKTKTLEDFKSAFEPEFVRAKNLNEDSEFVKPIIGKVIGTLENEVKKIAKSSGLENEIDSDEYKSNKFLNEKLSFVIKKLGEKSNSQIEEWKTKASQGNDEKVKEYEKKLSSAEQKKKDLEELLNQTKGEYNTFKEQASNQLKGFKLNIIKKDAFSKLPLKSDIKPIELKGFEATIYEKYKLDIDENDVPTVMDTKGARIPSTKVTGTFKTFEEILQEEATAAGIYQMNSDGGKPRQVQAQASPNNQTTSSTQTRTVAQRM